LHQLIQKRKRLFVEVNVPQSLLIAVTAIAFARFNNCLVAIDCVYNLSGTITNRHRTE
jgi:hypothetical protein